MTDFLSSLRVVSQSHTIFSFPNWLFLFCILCLACGDGERKDDGRSTDGDEESLLEDHVRQEIHHCYRKNVQGDFCEMKKDCSDESRCGPAPTGWTYLCVNGVCNIHALQETDGDSEPSEDGDKELEDPVEDGDSDVENECTPHASAACDGNAAYWYDSCGNRGELKEDCGTLCTCSYGSCAYHPNRVCFDGDVYGLDCFGNHTWKVEECGFSDCCGGECMYMPFPCCDWVCTDPVTGLQWEQEPWPYIVSNDWASAIEYCENLDLDGGGWRLPNITELRSLIRDCPSIELGGDCSVADASLACGVEEEGICLLSESCTDHDDCAPDECEERGNFGIGGCYWPSSMQGFCNQYWSSSTVEDRPEYAWTVHFNWPSVSYYLKTIDSITGPRCVREGP